MGRCSLQQQPHWMRLLTARDGRHGGVGPTRCPCCCCCCPLRHSSCCFADFPQIHATSQALPSSKPRASWHSIFRGQLATTPAECWGPTHLRQGSSLNSIRLTSARAAPLPCNVSVPTVPHQDLWSAAQLPACCAVSPRSCCTTAHASATLAGLAAWQLRPLSSHGRHVSSS